MDIKTLKTIFGSNAKAQEILILLAGAKPCVRQGFYEHEIPAVKEFCRKNGLFDVWSKFKVKIADCGDYSNKGLRTDTGGMQFAYISKDEKTAYLAAYYEQMSEHRKLGQALGYPDCCIEFFCKEFSSKNVNPEQKPTNALTNISKRDQDLVIISHFPCSSECKRSIELGKRYLNIIKDADKGLGELLLKKLEVER